MKIITEKKKNRNKSMFWYKLKLNMQAKNKKTKKNRTLELAEIYKNNFVFSICCYLICQ